MSDLHLFLLIVWVHFVADFVMQSKRMAETKSTDNKFLLSHCAVYTAFFIPFGLAYAFDNAIYYKRVNIMIETKLKAYDLQS